MSGTWLKVYVNDGSIRKAFEENVRSGLYSDQQLINMTKLMIRQLLSRDTKHSVVLFDYIHPEYRKHYGVGKKKAPLL